MVNKRKEKRGAAFLFFFLALVLFSYGFGLYLGLKITGFDIRGQLFLFNILFLFVFLPILIIASTLGFWWYYMRKDG
jgi:hypothetical protein